MGKRTRLPVCCLGARSTIETKSPNGPHGGPYAKTRARVLAHATQVYGAMECSRRHLEYSQWVQADQEFSRSFHVEIPITRFDDNEKAITAGELERGDVEERVIGSGQAVEREHS